ncbi:MAG: transcriptional repressor [Nitrosospira sp.]|nr:transcriptional repressor [Nitrosospira sp.]
MLEFHKQAEEMIRNQGERVTPGRVRVLAALLAEKRAVTHHEIEERVRDDHKLDRVTLYRVLDWLTEKCLAHRVVSKDRVWRFRASADAQTHQHAHFECTRCTGVFCLGDLKAEYDYLLPTGYRSQEIELTVKGICAECP